MLEKKKHIALYLISLSWVFWLFAVLVFPTQLAHQSRYDSVTSVSEQTLPNYDQFISSVESVGVPHFQIDWTLIGKFNPDWGTVIFKELLYKFPFFHESSFPLFNVIKTFILFYYTW